MELSIQFHYPLSDDSCISNPLSDDSCTSNPLSDDSCISFAEYHNPETQALYLEINQQMYQHFDPDLDGCLDVGEMNEEFRKIDKDGEARLCSMLPLISSNNVYSEKHNDIFMYKDTFKGCKNWNKY